MKKIFLSLIVFIGLLTLTSCSEEIKKDKVVINHNDVDYEVITNPSKVITFDLGVLDILDHIGLDKLGIEKLGVPNASFPKYLDKYSNEENATFVGTMKEYDSVAIELFEAELIIISGRLATKEKEIRDKFNVPVINMAVLATDYTNGILTNLDTLTKIFTEKSYTDTINIINSNLEKKLAEVKSTTLNKTEKGLFLMVNNLSMSLFNTGSRYDMVFNDAGVKDVAKDYADLEGLSHGQAVSSETISVFNPDIIYVMDRAAVAGSTGEVSTAKDLINNDALIKKTNAYKNGKIIYVNPSIWYLSTGGYNSTISMFNDIISAF